MLLVALSAARPSVNLPSGRGKTGIARRASGIVGGLDALKKEQEEDEAWQPVKWVKSSEASYRSEMAKQFAQHLEHLRGYVAESLGFWADGGDGHGKLEVTMEIW